MPLVSQLSIKVHRKLSHDGAEAHAALGISLISLLRLEYEQEMLLLQVLLVGDDRLDGQYGAAGLPQRLGVVIDVRCRVDPVVVWDRPDHALETRRMDFNVEVRLARSLDLHVHVHVHITHNYVLVQ